MSKFYKPLMQSFIPYEKHHAHKIKKLDHDLKPIRSAKLFRIFLLKKVTNFLKSYFVSLKSHYKMYKYLNQLHVK